MKQPGGSGLKTSELLYKGSIIGMVVTLPSLATFMLVWHFADDLIVAAVASAIVYAVSMVASFKIAKVISAKHAPKE